MWKRDNRQEHNPLGFSNVSSTSILIFLENGRVHYWMPQWEFDSKLRMWNIIYTEGEWKEVTEGIPSFQENTKAFLEILHKIEKFAKVIGADFFANSFHEAVAILLQEKELEVNENFGTMGSWNDESAYMARQKGLAEEYSALSGELLIQIRNAILYAINEW